MVDAVQNDKIGLPEQEVEQDRTTRTGQLLKESQNGTGSTGKAKQNSQDKTAKKGSLGQGRQDRMARKGLDRTARSG